MLGYDEIFRHSGVWEFWFKSKFFFCFDIRYFCTYDTKKILLKNFENNWEYFSKIILRKKVSFGGNFFLFLREPFLPPKREKKNCFKCTDQPTLLGRSVRPKNRFSCFCGLRHYNCGYCKLEFCLEYAAATVCGSSHHNSWCRVLTTVLQLAVATVAGADPRMVRIGTGPPPPFWQINHANSAYFRLFWGYFWVISTTRPPLLDLGPPPFLHILDPPLQWYCVIMKPIWVTNWRNLGVYKSTRAF